MVYTVTSDSATKISESSGTIQNHSRDWDIEISNSADFTDKILLYPRQNYSFADMDVYLRCAEQGMSAEVFVVPFSVDVGGGDVSSVDTTALKSVTLDGNTLNFYTSSDTAQAAYSVDIPAEQFLDQAATTFVPNFYFSAILYPDAVNPNLDGKPVFVLGVKSKSNDGLSNTIKYSFIDVSKLVDTYVASDTSVTVSDYKLKVNISPDAGNALKLKSNGLYADGVTDTATSSTFGLTKLYNGTGTNTDGTITQAAITTEINNKASTDTATTSSNGLMSAADKVKLDGIESNAQVNVIELVKVNGTPLVPDANKAVNITGAGSGGGLQPIIQITCDSSDITVTKSGVNYPATSHVDNVHTFTVPEFGTYTVTATSAELGFSRTGAVVVDAVKVYTVSLAFALRYGYRIKKNEADPYARVEYLYDAVGMTPAHMDFDNGVFDYGSWKDVWFVADNKPLMLKSNGTVDYYLNPNDYTLKKDGTASDVANENYDGNAMAQFPLCWIYRYEDNDYLYEIVSNVQYDENYKAYAHTDASGKIKDFFYHSLFSAVHGSGKLRSLSGANINNDISFAQKRSAAFANGANWDVSSWSQRSLINTLLVLICKSTNTRENFGYGYNGQIFLDTGSLSQAGQFFGYNDSTHRIKVFHIEDYWGNIRKFVTGWIKNNDGFIYVKMTPEGTGYRINDVQGYTKIKDALNGNGYIKSMLCNEYGLFPTDNSATNTTYFCDFWWWGNNTSFSGLYILGLGSEKNNSATDVGAFSQAWYYSSSENGGCDISYV